MFWQLVIIAAAIVVAIRVYRWVLSSRSSRPAPAAPAPAATPASKRPGWWRDLFSLSPSTSVTFTQSEGDNLVRDIHAQFPSTVMETDLKKVLKGAIKSANGMRSDIERALASSAAVPANLEAAVQELVGSHRSLIVTNRKSADEREEKSKQLRIKTSEAEDYKKLYDDLKTVNVKLSEDNAKLAKQLGAAHVTNTRLKKSGAPSDSDATAEMEGYVKGLDKAAAFMGSRQGGKPQGNQEGQGGKNRPKGGNGNNNSSSKKDEEKEDA